jgi:hypothetical protein
MLKSQNNWHRPGEMAALAFSTACYMSQIGVTITLNGEPFQLAGHSIQSFTRLCEKRGWVQED